MNKIKKLRSERGMTLDQFAAKTGVGIATIARLENGGKAYASTLGKIAGALEIDLTELMEFEAVSGKKENPLNLVKDQGVLV